MILCDSGAGRNSPEPWPGKLCLPARNGALAVDFPTARLRDVLQKLKEEFERLRQVEAVGRPASGTALGIWSSRTPTGGRCFDLCIVGKPALLKVGVGREGP